MSDAQVEITIQRAGEPDRLVTLRPGVAHIGRAEDTEVPLPDKGVSRRHVRLLVEPGVVHVEDLGSGNGTYFRGGRVHQVDLADGDQLYVDPFTLIFRFSSAPAEVPRRAQKVRVPLRPARLVALAGARVEAEYPLKTETVTLGRSNQREIVIYDPGASRLQAEIVWRDDGWWLVDGASANGTYLNGERVSTQRLQTGDRIRIGATELRFEDGGSAPPAPSRAAPVQVAAPTPVGAHPVAAPGPRAPAPPPPVAAAAPQVDAPPQVVAAPPRGPSAAPVAPSRPARPSAPAPRSPLRRMVVAGLALFALGCLVLSALLFWLALNPGSVDALLARGSTGSALTPAVAAPVSPEVAKGLEEGRALFDKGSYMEATARYYEVRKAAPESLDAARMIYLSSEFLALQTLRDALVVRATPPAQQQAALQSALTLADAALAGKGDPVVAREALERALTFFPGHPRATEALAKLGPTPSR